MLKLSKDSLKFCFRSKAFDFYSDEKKQFLYKFCRHKKYYSRYSEEFTRECNLMQNLYKTYPELAPLYFPAYYDAAQDIDGCPYVKMSYIHGTPLNIILKKKHLEHFHNTPYMPFQKTQLLNLFKQLHKILHLLYQQGVCYFDLNPANIIVMNAQDLRICLVDFSFCYYLEGPEDQEFKKISNQFHSDWPLELQIEHTLQLLLALLYFQSETDFMEYLKCFYCKPGENNRETFFHQQTSLFPLLLTHMDLTYMDFVNQRIDAIKTDCIDVNYSPLRGFQNWYKILNTSLVN